MKTIIATIGLMLACICSRAESPVSTNELDVIEAEFRYQFQHNTSGAQTNAAVFFIAMGRETTPPDEFLARFKDVSTPVKASSESIRDDANGSRITDAITGQVGLLFTHSEIHWITDTKAEVICLMAEANQSRSVKRLTIELIDGRWVVTKDELIAIS